MLNNFRVILANQRKSIADVHEVTGVSKSTLTNLYYERSKNPELQTLIKIANYLKVSLDELLKVESEVD